MVNNVSNQVICEMLFTLSSTQPFIIRSISIFLMKLLTNLHCLGQSFRKKNSDKPLSIATILSLQGQTSYYGVISRLFSKMMIVLISSSVLLTYVLNQDIGLHISKDLLQQSFLNQTKIVRFTQSVQANCPSQYSGQAHRESHQRKTSVQYGFKQIYSSQSAQWSQIQVHYRCRHCSYPYHLYWLG